MELTNKAEPSYEVFKQSCVTLTPEQTHEMFKHFDRIPEDREFKYVDFQLLDALAEMNEDCHANFPIHELRRSVKHGTRVTKRFYHVAPTYVNLDHFVDVSFDRPNFTWNVNYQCAKSILMDWIGVGQKLKPVEIRNTNDLYQVWSNKDAKAGAIGNGSKAEYDQEIFEAFSRIKTLIKQGIPFSKIQIPNYPFHRSQISNYVVDGKFDESNLKMKDRLVWGSDGATVSVEGQYAKPFIQHCINQWYGYIGGDEPSVIRRKIRHSGEWTRYWYGIDYSLFDQSIQSWLIHDMFEIVKRFFPKECHDELDFISYNFINTKMIIPGHDIVVKHRGIPSGSNFTQVIGSMCNAMMILTYLCSRHGGNASSKINYVKARLRCGGRKQSMYVMGDDNLMFYQEEVDLTALSKYVNRFFGVTIHPDKTDTWKTCKNPHFLKREWVPHGFEYREFLDLMINVIHPERRREYANYSPWHIIFGLFLTYRETFGPLVTERYLLEKMQQNFGVIALKELDMSELPGALRVFGRNGVNTLYDRAITKLGIAA